MRVLWAAAKKEGLQKFEGWIYKPVGKDKPAAYVRYVEYDKFINNKLRDHPVFTATPKRFSDIEKHLEHYDDGDLPFMEPDKNVLSFRNGCLLVKTVEFVPYTDKRVKNKV